MNEHLTLEEIRRVLRPANGSEDASQRELQDHLARCPECSEMKELCEPLMPTLDQFRRAGQAVSRDDCPPLQVWIELAAGLLPQKETFERLNHAATCRVCAVELNYALEAMGGSSAFPPERQPDLNPAGLQTSELKTADESWQNSFSQQMALRSRQHSVPSVVAPKKRSSVLHFPVWGYAAVAAVVLVSLGVGIFFRLQPATPEKLLALAYSQQRTLELRIPGAGYGPIQVQRDAKRSQLSSPGALLDAEAAIKRGLERRPEDPDLLRQKAEADLLNRDYQPAMESLAHALRIQPQSPRLLLDLATARFERGEATDNPSDYEAALQYLGDALRLSPKDPAVLFNRAIVYERLFLYSRAEEDWNLLLSVETDPGWRLEAQRRLDDLHSKQHHSARDAPDGLTPAQFEAALKNKQTADPEDYLHLAERQILPNIQRSDLRDQNYQLMVLLSLHLRDSHADRFLFDLLPAISGPRFHEAAVLLGQASTANHAGHSEEAYLAASRAEHLFEGSGNPPGTLAAQFEKVYALQFESKTEECREAAADLVIGAQRIAYTWLEIQSLLEQAICSNMGGDLGAAKLLAQKAIRLAKDRDYPSFYLRGLTLLGDLESVAGDESSAWSAAREGLRRYWNGNLPPARAYNFYILMEETAERLGHWNVQFAAAYEALALSPNRIFEAAERSRVGNAALRLGDTRIAEEQFAQAARLFSSTPPTESAQWVQLQARIGLARAQSLNGGHPEESFAALLAYLPEVKRLSNRYVGPEYYTTLAELKIRMGEPQAAQEWFADAILLADSSLASLHTWPERLTWVEQNRQPYLVMTQLLFQSKREDAALEVWEHYRSASPGSSPQAAFSPAQSRGPAPNHALVEAKAVPLTTTLTYAITPNGVMIWVRDGRERHSVYISLSSSDLNRAAEEFLEECSRPDSDAANLRANAQALYKWLIRPVRDWLPESGHITVEPDGILGVLPMDAFIDESGAYLGERYSLTTAPARIAGGGLPRSPAIVSGDRMVIVAAPVNPDGSFAPPPEALSEATRIAEQFTRPVLLMGSKAKFATVKREIARGSIFHFAGHAILRQSGAAMLLADGSFRLGDTGLGEYQMLNPRSHSYGLPNMKLAVFSACGTARPSEMSQSDSLVTEFLQAGTPNVVASRWDVDSVATADFMTLFYRSALSGHDVADALRRAASVFRTTPGRTHPYYWAAFSVFGNA